MTLTEFINKYDGKGIDYDGAYGYQCMDLYRQYCKEVLKVPQSTPVPAAKDVWNNYRADHFERIDNTPSGVPQPGDVIIWGTKLGQYGHIAVFVSGNTRTFKSFDQNFPVGSKCQVVSHTYTGVIGWLRPKKQVVTKPQEAPVSQVDIALEQFKACFISWVTTWPSDSDIADWRNSGKLPWQYVQDKYITPSTEELLGRSRDLRAHLEDVTKRFSDYQLHAEQVTTELRNQRDDALEKATELSKKLDEALKETPTPANQEKSTVDAALAFAPTGRLIAEICGRILKLK